MLDSLHTARPAQALMQELVDVLTLEKIDDNIYRGQSLDFVGKRIFGGQVLGQALRAASYTTDRPAHSIHAHFLLAGDVTAPVVYQVERLRDGYSFVSRQVKALQFGKVIFSALISFAPIEEGLEYQEEPPIYPAADDLPSEKELKLRIAPFVPENLRERFVRDRHIDLRYIDPTNPLRPQKQAPKSAQWMRVDYPLPDDLALHQAIVAFASDYGLMGTGLMPHGIGFLSPKLQAASLDHVLYFHKPMRADVWMLHDMHATVTSNARGLNFGKIWQNGQLVASTVQEGLMRIKQIKDKV